MKTKTFSDKYDNRGTIGSRVIGVDASDKPYGEIKTVKLIDNRRKGGVFLYFEEGGHSRATNFKILD